MGQSAGRLAVGLAGGAVGYAFGAPALGFIGASFLGGMIFPPEPFRIEGSPPDDLKISASTRGKPKPIGFGTGRYPGMLIWASDIRRETVEQSTGGKGGLGGPSTETTTYIDRLDFAMAFVGREAEAILRIAADNKPIYDVRDPATTGATFNATLKPGVTVRTYLGTQTQERDPAIEAALGTANSTAYRGTVYVVFENFDLTDYGRIPQIWAEIAFKAEGADSGEKSTDIASPLTQHEGIFVDYEREIIYTIDQGNDPPNTGLRLYSLQSIDEVLQRTSAEMNLTSVDLESTDVFTIGRYTGRLYFGHQNNSMEIDIVDPDALVKVGSVGTLGGSIDFNHSVFNDNPSEPDIAGFSWFEEFTSLAPPTAEEADPRKIYLIGHGAVTDGPYLLDVTDPLDTKGVVWQNGSLPSTNSLGGVGEPPALGRARFWEVHHGGGNSEVKIFLWDVLASARMFNVAPNQMNFDGVTWTEETTFPTSVWDDDVASAGTFIQGPIYDETDGNLIFLMSGDNSTCKVWKWDKENDVILWNVRVESALSIGIRKTSTRVRNGRIGFTHGAPPGTYFVLDTLSGEVVDQGASMDATVPGGWWCLQEYVWDDTTSCFISQAQFGSQAIERYCVGRKTGLGEPLSSVVDYLSTDRVNGAGLTDSQIDVSDLVPYTVRHYPVTRRMAAQKAVEPLMVAWDFDAAEIDGQEVFVKRGKAPVATITQDELVDRVPLVPEKVTEEHALPSQIDLEFIDVEIDYQDNHRRAKRPSAPIPAMYSRNKIRQNLTIGFTATEAGEIVQRMLHTAWTQRRTLPFQLTGKYLYLTPTDVIDLQLKSGTEYELRITKESPGVNHTQRYEATVQARELQIPTGVVADPSDGFKEPELPQSTLARLAIIDGPYLRDVDATQRNSIEIKLALGGLKSGFQSGSVWDSEDGFNYRQSTLMPQAMTYGIMQSAFNVGTFRNSLDIETRLQVRMVEGALQSVTTAEFWANEQVALIGDPFKQNFEYVCFRDAVQVTTDVWEVSYLLRGRRGTGAPEISDSHGVGELFVVADRAYMDRILLDLNQLNQTRYYRGVGQNSFVEVAETVPLATKGGALKPFHPSQVAAVYDGGNNIDITCERSDRLGFELSGSKSWATGELSEASEEYEWDVYDGATFKRTLNATTTAVQYDNADIVTDFGGLPSEITLEGFQMSAEVGRGFSTGKITLQV